VTLCQIQRGTVHSSKSTILTLFTLTIKLTPLNAHRYLLTRYVEKTLTGIYFVVILCQPSDTLTICSHKYGDLTLETTCSCSSRFFLSKMQNIFQEIFIKCYYDNWMSTNVCSDESDTFSTAFSHLTSTSLTHSNCPHTQTQHCIKKGKGFPYTSRMNDPPTQNTPISTDVA